MSYFICNYMKYQAAQKKHGGFSSVHVEKVADKILLNLEFMGLTFTKTYPGGKTYHISWKVRSPFPFSLLVLTKYGDYVITGMRCTFHGHLLLVCEL